MIYILLFFQVSIKIHCFYDLLRESNHCFLKMKICMSVASI